MKLTWPQFYKDLTRKTFIVGCSWFKFSNFGQALSLEILHHCRKKVETLKQKFWGVNSYLCRSYWGKTVRRKAFCPPLPRILNSVKTWSSFSLIKNSFSCLKLKYLTHAFDLKFDWILPIVKRLFVSLSCK